MNCAPLTAGSGAASLRRRGGMLREGCARREARRGVVCYVAIAKLRSQARISFAKPRSQEPELKFPYPPPNRRVAACEHEIRGRASPCPSPYPPLRRRLAAPDPAVKGVQFIFVFFKRRRLFLATRPHSFFKPLLNPGFGGMAA